MLAISVAFAAVAASAAPAGEADSSYFIARTNKPTWMIRLENVKTHSRTDIRSNYISGDSYIAVQLVPGTYRITQYGRYDTQLVLPKLPVEFTVTAGCTNYYGRLDLYEDGTILPGKPVVSDDGSLNTNDLRNLGIRIRELFHGRALCVSGGRDDFRFEWDSISRFVAGK